MATLYRSGSFFIWAILMRKIGKFNIKKPVQEPASAKPIFVGLDLAVKNADMSMVTVIDSMKKLITTTFTIPVNHLRDK